VADFLEREVFGPVLHIVRYDPDKLEEVAGKLAARGYGLTLGVHGRIEGFWRRVQALVPAGTSTSTAPSSGPWWACSRSAGRG
jgi:RHH-type proline utilization regulon transcriptional repressor/proline dehydrogenase/delta 1-pyrroline-5-carboxylate dehydrogenase